MRTTRDLLGAGLLAAALVLTGCAGGDGGATADGPGDGGSPSASDSATSPTPEPTERPRRLRYVALGDSYTSAPLVPKADLTTGCFRSTGNYPHLVAKARPEIRLRDVSCGGAASRHMTETQQTVIDPNPPQFDALRRNTDLVTIGLGGNDLGLFGSIVDDCTAAGEADPTGSPCTDEAIANFGSVETRITDTTALIQADLEDVVAGVKERSPNAQIIMIGYPQLVPPSGTCAALPLGTGDYAYARAVNAGVNGAVKRAARATDVEFVNVLRASRGHDVCSDKPWVNGKDVDPSRASEYHPFPREQRAVARRILDRL